MPDDSVLLAAFTEDDVSAILQDDVLLGIHKYKSMPAPQAILLAGQPGAGKTILSAMMIQRLCGNAAFINGDDYRRYHPNYKKICAEFGQDSAKFTSPFSNMVVERLIEVFSDRQVNMIVEGTGRDAKVPEATARNLTLKGYSVELAVIATRPEVSLTSTLLRFYQMNDRGTPPRATAMDAHDLVVKNLPDNLDILQASPHISRITIWNRELEPLYDSSVDVCTPSMVLLDYWEQRWSVDELETSHAQIALLREKEKRSMLGQSSVIDELEHRIDAAAQTQSFGMTMM